MTRQRNPQRGIDMEETNLSDSADGTLGNGRSIWQWFNIAVVACILVLAVLLGILNNLRVADERKVKWFEAPADRADQKTVAEVP